MDNQQIANVFEEIGNLLEVDGANRFRVLAYQNAAENIRGLGRELQDIWREDTDSLENLPGIGHDLRLKIEEMLTTGICKFHQDLVKKFGRGVLDILEIRGIGPRKVALFYKALKIDNLEKLKAAALAHKLSELPRMGEKSEEEILRAIEEHAKYNHRMLLSEALPLAEKILEYLRALPEIARAEYAGSLRRRKETIGDLDFLAAPQGISDSSKILEYFEKLPLVKNVIASGPTKCSVILENGVQADLRVVELKSFGAAWHYFTGSKDHNVEIRTIAIKAKMKINEYGIFKLIKQPDKTIKEEFITGDSEDKFYQAVGLRFIPPTLRETRGEFEASINNELPDLIELEDLQGDLNVNSNFSEGKLTLLEIAELYSQNNFNYIAIADTLSTTEIPSSFTPEKLERQISEIEILQKKFPSLKIFKSAKIPINGDGSLDLPSEEILKKLDFLTVKINHDFTFPEPRQTSRVITALNFHPKVKILSCPSCRILNQREVIAINMEKIIEECVQKRKFLEINSQPDRLDLPDYQIKLAVEKGAQLAINSDLKTADHLDYLKFGIWTAQRGWAEKRHIINALPFKKVINLFTK